MTSSSYNIHLNIVNVTGIKIIIIMYYKVIIYRTFYIILTQYNLFKMTITIQILLKALFKLVCKGKCASKHRFAKLFTIIVDQNCPRFLYTKV